ncbi:MAG TPA: sulfatase-like hydrolase/transferase [Acidobacteriota bacterium]|nr:sulfatase-like hydrolase/transferase [Acidobacteriota bacterium]
MIASTGDGRSLQDPADNVTMISPNWNRFFAQYRKDVTLWFMCVALLLIERIVFVWYFRGAIADTTSEREIIYAVLGGFRYDSVVAFYWMLLPLVGSILCGFFNIARIVDGLRRVVATVFIVTAVLLSIVAFGYYRTFGDIFNEMFFGIYYDDTGAILSTIRSEFPVIPIVLLALVLIVAGYFVVGHFLRHEFLKRGTVERHIATVGRKIVVTIIAALFVLVAARGSVGKRPVQRLDGGITTDLFLNKAVFNPIYALKSALKDHRLLLSAKGIEEFCPDGDLWGAARVVCPTAANPGNIDDCLLKYAQGPKGHPARHIFVIIGEAYDTWPMLDEYASLRLTESLKALGDSGVFVRQFLPAATRTMWSLAPIFTGLANAGVYVNYQPSGRTPFPSSAAATFQRLGYRTRLFYGGYLTWQRIGEFAEAQGFEETYGAAHIGLWTSNNTWGVDDEYVYDFVMRTVQDDTPSFNVILTTTYHLPYDIDVWAKGYPVRTVPDDLESVWDGSVELKWLGHLWYADHYLGAFIRQTTARLPASVFAATGDHASHLFVNARRPFYEKASVPLVLYGPEVLGGFKPSRELVGSHLDIVPTLIELAAPKGFAYHAIGQDILSPDHLPLGFARGRVIGPDFVVDFGDNTGIHPVAGRPLPDPLPDLQEIRRRHDALLALSWWRIMRGPTLPEPATAAAQD